jgi:hypothetical protein
MTPRHLLLALGLAGAGAMVVFGDKTPANGVAEAVARAPARVAMPAAPAAEGPFVQALRPRGELIGEAVLKDDQLFGSQNWAPPPPPPSAAPAVPPVQMAPPLPYTYIGKALQDGRWSIFLARGSQTYIVTAGTTIDGAYRVDHVVPPVLSLTYLPLSQVQQINIGAID